MKPYVVYRTKNETLPDQNTSRLYTADFRGCAADTRYRKILDIFKGSSDPIEMVFEVFEARPGLTVTYANMRYRQDGQVHTRIYHSVTPLTAEEMFDLQAEIGSPVSFTCKSLKVTIKQKDTGSVLTLTIDERNNVGSVYTETINHKTGEVKRLLKVLVFEFKKPSTWRRLLSKLTPYQNPKKPFKDYGGKHAGEIIDRKGICRVIFEGGWLF